MKREMNKCLLQGILMLVLFLAVCGGFKPQVRADESPFVISDGALVSYTGEGGEVQIPSGVTKIGAGVFRYNNNVEKVVLPDTVREIGENAFYYCKNLKEINLPEGLTTIGDNAFFYCFSLTKIRIPKTVSKVGAGSITYGITYVECYKGTAGFEYVKTWVDDCYSVLDAKDFSTLTVKLSKSSFVYNGKSQIPEVTVYDGNKKLVRDTDYAMTAQNTINVGQATVTLTAKAGEKGEYRGTRTVSYTIIPQKTAHLVSGVKTSSTAVVLQWTKDTQCTHYQVQRYDFTKKKWSTLTTTTKNTYTDKKRAANTRYRYRVRGINKTKEKTLYGAFAVLDVYTLPKLSTMTQTSKTVSQGGASRITSLRVNVGTNLNTSDIGWMNWSHVSPVSQFLDQSGNYCFAYEVGQYLYIRKYSSKLKLLRTIKIRKLYTLLGGVACDSKGNYFVVWGKDDTAGKGNVDTMAISKYTNLGKFVKTTKFYTEKNATAKRSDDTQYPFEGGNCNIVIQGTTLICAYARQMYNGHQSNDVISVNTTTMKAITKYNNFCSHAFNQDVFVSNGGEVVYLDHGDAGTRGFLVEKQSFETGAEFRENEEDYAVPFQFYGKSGDNYTGAQMGGIAETSSGYMLAAAAPKSLTQKANTETKNVFVQLLGKSDLTSLLSGSTRQGTSCGIAAKNTGIKWLTSYSSSYQANAVSITATDDDRVVVMWEKLDKNGSFVNSYYMVLAANGRTLQKATSLGFRRLNLYEKPVYKNGAIYWTKGSEGSGKAVTIYRMEVNKLVIDKTVGNVEDVTGGSIYVRAASGYRTVAAMLSWSSADMADGYEIYRANSQNGTYQKLLTTKGNRPCEFYDTSVTANQTYYYKIRGYKTVSGKKVTGKYSAVCKVSVKN